MRVETGREITEAIWGGWLAGWRNEEVGGHWGGNLAALEVEKYLG